MGVYRIQKTDTFDRWLRKLRDVRAKGLILSRVKKAELGNLGEYRSVGKRVSEMKIDYGPGYHIYFTRVKGVTILLLIGGDKSTQTRDIRRAQELAAGIGG
jgi:putative addiction module killer protein